MTWWIITNSTSKTMYATYVNANTFAMLVALLKSYSIFREILPIVGFKCYCFICFKKWYDTVALYIQHVDTYQSNPKKHCIGSGSQPSVVTYIEIPLISPSCLEFHFIVHKDKTKGGTRILGWTRSRSSNFVVVVRYKRKVWSKSNFNGWVQSSRLPRGDTTYVTLQSHRGFRDIWVFVIFGWLNYASREICDP